MPPADNNPFAQAAGAYGNTSKQTPNQRELEAHVLMKSARMLNDVRENWDQGSEEALNDALQYNRQIWMVFYDTAVENENSGQSNDFRSNIINLANFIFKREIDIRSNPEKDLLDALISINKELSAGLMSKPQG
ncbi:MAG: flagellar FlaF family protein [Micavibrio sp.]|nr:flagellar FlaF family protein [Micavibrio sp.]|tara:strand:+ start:108 stop:509 length:402 start_codon:yes stop_codon:yes gene_type:complete